MKISCVIVILFTLFSESIRADQKTDRVMEFQQLTMTRGWELGIWRIKNENKIDKNAKMFKLSMTAQAFRYWHLVHEGLISKNLVYEAQIRRSFRNGDLDASTLKDPLYRKENNKGGFGIGVILTTEEYQKLSDEFERFFLGESK